MIPLWLKLSYTIVAAVIIAIYAKKYGLSHFLWFSDIALLLLIPALWLENEFLASMMAVGVLLPEIFWNVSFFARLLFGIRITGITDYMFDPEKPLYLRGLSLFHVFLPPLLLWLTARLGYVPTAVLAETALAWIVLPLTYWLTDPEKENVNWVHRGFGYRKRLRPIQRLWLVMIATPVVIFLPTHLLLDALFG